MYESFFGLRELPFSLTPDPRFLWLSDTHEEGLATLVYGIFLAAAMVWRLWFNRGPLEWIFRLSSWRRQRRVNELVP